MMSSHNELELLALPEDVILSILNLLSFRDLRAVFTIDISSRSALAPRTMHPQRRTSAHFTLVVQSRFLAVIVCACATYSCHFMSFPRAPDARVSCRMRLGPIQFSSYAPTLLPHRVCLVRIFLLATFSLTIPSESEVPSNQRRLSQSYPWPSRPASPSVDVSPSVVITDFFIPAEHPFSAPFLLSLSDPVVKHGRIDSVCEQECRHSSLGAVEMPSKYCVQCRT